MSYDEFIARILFTHYLFLKLKDMKKIIILITTILLITPSVFAQTPDANETIVDEKQLEESYNLVANVQNMVDQLKTGRIGNVSDIFVSITTLLICVGAICSICTKASSAVLKGDVIKLEVLIKPFIFALIIGSYQPIIKGIDWTISAFDGLIVTIGNESLQEVLSARELKSNLIVAIEYKIGEEASAWDKIEIAAARLKSWITYYPITMFIFCATFLTKLTGAVLSMVFYIIGPITIALSAIPAFSDNWKNWLSKYIWVLLFTPICRIIAWVLQEVELIILKSDISRLTYCLDNFEETKGGIATSGGSFMEGTAYLGFMVVGGMLFLAVPSIASWVVNTSGGGVMTAMNTLGVDSMSKASQVGKEVAAGGANITGKGIGMAAKGIGKGLTMAVQAIRGLRK